jgi:hypothetical protein
MINVGLVFCLEVVVGLTVVGLAVVVEVVLIVVRLAGVGVDVVVVVFGVVVAVEVALVAVGVTFDGLVVGVIFVVMALDPICFNFECLVVDMKTGDGRSLVDEKEFVEGTIEGRFGAIFLIDITEFATKFSFFISDEFWSILVSSFVSESSKEGGDGGPGR